MLACVGECCLHVRSVYTCGRTDVRGGISAEISPGLFLPCFLLPLNVREVIKPIRSVGSQSTDRRTVRGIHFQSAAASTL